MSILNKIGITLANDTQAETVFEKLHDNFLDFKYKTPCDYVSKYWHLYENTTVRNNSLNGRIFEFILSTLFIREGLLPFYLSAKVAFVPNVIYDIMFYTTERGPICISAKTSLRERYKQADLEAIALKYVHRKAISYLVTLDGEATKGVKDKIIKGDVIGIDKVILANSEEFDIMVDDLKKYTFSDPPTVKVIKSKQVINQTKIASITS